ncbi:MAG: hypothetical protein HY795_01615 [Desulfovibrio sp.]|jgi:hypothetical protein|nr:hypothetical protein [Desulfovibrio sp.]MBI4960045.1 hypothetical protein [Desulfovibrio sp.]
MNIYQALQLRKALGWVTAALLFAALACLADALAMGFKGEGREFQAIPGTTIPVTSYLPPGATTIEEMRIRGADEAVSLVPESLFSGFWLGGNMWRGSFVVSSTAKPGARTIVIEGPPLEKPSKNSGPITFLVTVHEDELSLRLASQSFITRTFGYNPFAACVFCVLLAVPGGFGGFLLSRRIDRMLTLEGKALIYMLKKTEEGSDIAFSLGSKQGLSPGMTVRIYDTAGQAIGEAQVTASMSEDATARIVSGSCKIGDMVILSSGDSPLPGADAES